MRFYSRISVLSFPMKLLKNKLLLLIRNFPKDSARQYMHRGFLGQCKNLSPYSSNILNVDDPYEFIKLMITHFELNLCFLIIADGHLGSYPALHLFLSKKKNPLNSLLLLLQPHKRNIYQCQIT